MEQFPERLVPPPTKGHVSVARLASFWYVACRSRQLSQKPLARSILGIPMVLFRDGSGNPGALLDRCPHRNAPLSLGRVCAQGVLECAYHGWQFDGSGACVRVPGLLGKDDGKQRRVTSFATREQDDLIWVYATPDCQPTNVPITCRPADTGKYTSVVREVQAEASLHATIENALDVPHTAFLHKGLFRGKKQHEIAVSVRRTPNQVEAEYRGEPRPEGLVGRLLSPGGGIVEHWDRFILPSIAQVEYRLGDQAHFLITSLCTPISDFRTHMYAIANFRTRLPGPLVKLALEPIAARIFKQDARILGEQTRNIRRFGGEQYISTELDFLGPHIWRLLRQAERGEAPGEAATVEQEVRFFA
jgi:phenylpropionate dioxygenase-like ring-hydroxylating dioxygenase large terminal subunit